LPGVNPIELLVLVAATNTITAGPFPTVTMLVSSDRAIIGEHVNGSPAGSAGLRESSRRSPAVALFATCGL